MVHIGFIIFATPTIVDFIVEARAKILSISVHLLLCSSAASSASPVVTKNQHPLTAATDANIESAPKIVPRAYCPTLRNMLVQPAVLYRTNSELSKNKKH